MFIVVSNDLEQQGGDWAGHWCPQALCDLSPLPLLNFIAPTELQSQIGDFGDPEELGLLDLDVKCPLEEVRMERLCPREAVLGEAVVL